MSSQKSLAQLSAEKFFDPIAQAAFNAGYAQLPEAMSKQDHACPCQITMSLETDTTLWEHC
jgi:hypothetical protein